MASVRAQTDLSPYFARVSDNPLEEAFDDARQAHPPGGQIPVAREDHGAVWRKCIETPRTRPGMAYVHIPFCENHCLFCGFYQNAWRPESGPGYVDLVLKQATQLAGKPVLEGPPLRALYFGGGTPTALAAAEMGRMVCGLRDILPLAPDCEITLEGRIHSFTPDKMETAFKAGVNRISLGVQTFDTEIRRSLGRKATREKALATLQHLVACDSGAIVIDLMYGLPRQTRETWAEDLALVDELGLDGVDHYGLNLIPGTPLMSAVEKGKLSPITRKDLGAFYAQGFEAMQSFGWHPISTSHWQHPDLRERSIYNFGAKTGWDYFGLGAGAGGFVNGIGAFNTPVLEEYGAKVRAGAAPFKGMSRASSLAPLVNAVRAGMERARLDSRAVSTGFEQSGADGPDAAELLLPLLNQWQEAGLMKRRGRFHDLTLAGRFWQVQMTQRMTRLLSSQYLPADQATDDSWGLNTAKAMAKHKRSKENVS